MHRDYLADWHKKNPGKAKEYYDRAYAKNRHTVKVALSSIKTRAKREGIPFSLTEKDITIPEYCPALGIKLKHGDGSATDASPSVDRIVPELGYVPGNIVVISKRANNIKSNASADEIEKVAAWLRGIT